MTYRVELTEITDENNLPIVVEIGVKDKYAKLFEELAADKDIIGIGHVCSADGDFEI